MKNARPADFSFTNSGNRIQISPLKMQPVRNHQLYVRACGRIDHGLAFFFCHGHWFFTQHVIPASAAPSV